MCLPVNIYLSSYTPLLFDFLSIPLCFSSPLIPTFFLPLCRHSFCLSLLTLNLFFLVSFSPLQFHHSPPLSLLFYTFVHFLILSPAFLLSLPPSLFFPLFPSLSLSPRFLFFTYQQSISKSTLCFWSSINSDLHSLLFSMFTSLAIILISFRADPRALRGGLEEEAEEEEEWRARGVAWKGEYWWNEAEVASGIFATLQT